MNELVSIVVPIYNMGNSIEKCVESLQVQDYPNIEILLVDDGSKDDSYIKCKGIEKKDSRVKAFHTENRGSGPARNYGIEHAQGRYIYFPDADDYLEPQAISILVKAMNNGENDLVVFGFKNIDQDGNVKNIKHYDETEKSGEEIRKKYSPYMTISSIYGIQGAPWNKFFDKNLIDQHHIEFPPLRRHQDEGFIARYMCYVKRVHFITDVLYTYYTNDLSKEWDKYPVSYIEAVKGLYKERKNNILIWNQNDFEVHSLIYKEYVCNFIKALELSFSPKFGFNKKKRKKWILEQLNSMEIVDETKAIDKYHSIVYKLAQNKSFLLYPALEFKVFIERKGLLSKIKKMRKSK